MSERSPRADAATSASDATKATLQSAERSAVRPPPAPLSSSINSASSLGTVKGNGAAGTTTVSAASVTAVKLPVAQVVADESGEDLASPWGDWWLQVPSWLTSMITHLLLIIMLALLTTLPPAGVFLEDMQIESAGDGTPGNSDELQRQYMQAADELQPAPVDTPLAISEVPLDAIPLETMPMVAALPRADVEPRLSGIGSPLANIPGSGIGDGGAGYGIGNSLEIRISGEKRAELLQSGGGTRQSEAAVAAALKWLAEHQNYDGSWTFQHQKSPKCHGACSQPGSTPGSVAATALALLPFLGSGQTHQDGNYRRTVDLGLKHLVRTMQIEGDVGGLYEDPGGNMYGHGLASIVLCEAYGMTRDRTLQAPAQMAINYIVEAQDPSGGGWRYFPRQAGDTSVVGWQVMALRSAQMAYLKVPALTLRKTGYFLDGVQSDRGAAYGYRGAEARRPATTAIGLLCRMYLGWKHDQPALQRGVTTLATLGPSTDKSSLRNNMYYNYYATQVMHHYGGYQWTRWNEVMREYLIRTQSQRGHEAGSWFFDGVDAGGPPGGRLYFTALAAMTLEVYYRYMPLYRDDSTQVAP